MRTRASSALCVTVGVVVLLAWGASLSTAPPAAAAGQPPPRLVAASIDRFVRDYREQTGVPGITVAVTRGGRVVHAAGYGNTVDGDQMSARTPVPIASLSKAMTAAAVLQLVRAGLINLDRPLRDYVPTFTMADPRAASITVREVLNQRSGITDDTFPDLTAHQPASLAQAVAALHGAHLGAAPGTSYRYHNTNYVLAARLVEQVSGQPFASYLRSRVFAPLGMAQTRAVASTEDMPARAGGYVRAYRLMVAVEHPRIFTGGAYGVVTTAEDLARWLAAQTPTTRTPQARAVIADADLALMQTPPEGSDYAMGWWRTDREDGPPLIQHTGELFTHNSNATLLPRHGVGIAVVTNTGTLSGDDSNEIARGLVDLAEGRAPQVQTPFTMTADLVLAPLTLATAILGILGVRRARRWTQAAAHRPRWSSLARVLGLLLPVALLVELTALVGLVTNRSVTLAQTMLMWPALVAAVIVAAVASTVVLLTRLVVLTRLHRRRAEVAVSR